MVVKNDHSPSESVEDNIAVDYIPKSKMKDLPMANSMDDALKQKADKIKQQVEQFRDQIKKKFSFVEAVGIVPDQAHKIVEEEYEVSKEDADRKLVHLLMVIPEKEFKNIGKIRLETIDVASKINDKFWVHVMTPVDVWNLGLDSKFDVMEALSMSFPVLDEGILAALRVSQIHKSLVLRKFEKYVTSYVIAGSLVRGEARKDSDVDVFIVIDDTDVKRMSRLELKEKLRNIILKYIQEAQAMAGVKNVLNVQTYLLTEFWDSVKDAHPVMFTFIRDGVPLYDRGAFLPWKSLLRMGKIKPSPEAIDVFMSSGYKLEDNINRRLLDIAVLDIYWGVLTPTQGVLMLYGLAPPTPKETLKSIRQIFFEKEKLLEEKYVKILEEIVGFFKDYEHGKVKKISAEDLGKMSKNALDYISRLKTLRDEIDQRVQEKTVESTYDDLFGMLGSFLKKKGESSIIKAFDEFFIKQGIFSPRFLNNLKALVKIKKEVQDKVQKAKAKPKVSAKSKSKSSSKKKSKKKTTELTVKQGLEVDRAHKNAVEIMNAVTEYAQRQEMGLMERTRPYLLKGRDMQAEVFFLDAMYVIQGKKIQKLVDGKLSEVSPEDLRKAIIEGQQKEKKIDFKGLEDLKKMFGDFDLIY